MTPTVMAAVLIAAGVYVGWNIGANDAANCIGTMVGARIMSFRRAAVLMGLEREGILTEAAVPEAFPAQSGTALIAARYLNPNRIAVVQVGTRPGPNGIETFINVERLEPSEDQN